MKWILAYDSKRPTGHIAISEGKITRLYYAPYEGEHMFEIDEGECRTSWPRPGDNPWFVVEYRARIEHTQGERPEALRIWIGNTIQNTTA